ncbi:MAG: hypothetical protein HY808_10680 [Nitrospirae bacterium]|nr:hypothetical protein [Nitrospirota bacterium]
MRGHRITLVAAVCFFLHLSTSPIHAGDGEIIWKDVSSGISDADLQRVAIAPDNADIVYVSSEQVLYKTVDGGKNWREIFRHTGGIINAVSAAPADSGSYVFIGTDEGVYRSYRNSDGGMQWERIFRGIGELKNSVLSIAVHPMNTEIIFIGTRAGLFQTDNNGKEWKQARNLPEESAVTSIIIDASGPSTIYAAADNGLYKSAGSGEDWQRILVKASFENEDVLSIAEDTMDIDEIKGEAKIRSIAVDASDNKIIYAGTSAGLLITKDGGATWNTASSSGLFSRDIRCLAVSSKDPENLYAATARGVFAYSKKSESWQELYNGMASQDARYLAAISNPLDQNITLWAATKKGVFKTGAEEQNAGFPGNAVKTEHVLAKFAHEPSIEEIREAAIAYAEVQPDKISEWRRAAAAKALLPQLKFAYQKNIDWQKGDYFYSTAAEKYKDNDITRGDDKAWSVSVTWELGDLVWNAAQTAIDTRSRLMVQLRDDVLNEVTRLYFERRKLQIAMLLSPAEEINEKIEKELRLQELTADIDAMTDSYLSKRLNKQ